MSKKFIKCGLVLSFIFISPLNSVQALMSEDEFKKLRQPTAIKKERLLFADREKISGARKLITEAEQKLENEADEKLKKLMELVEKAKSGTSLSQEEIGTLKLGANLLCGQYKTPEDNTLGAVLHMHLVDYFGAKGEIKPTILSLEQAGQYDPDAERTYRIVYGIHQKLNEDNKKVVQQRGKGEGGAWRKGFLYGAGVGVTLAAAGWYFFGK